MNRKALLSTVLRRFLQILFELGTIQVLRQQRDGWVEVANSWRLLTRWVGAKGWRGPPQKRKKIRRKNFSLRKYDEEMLTSADKVGGSKKVKNMLTQYTQFITYKRTLRTFEIGFCKWNVWKFKAYSDLQEKISFLLLTFWKYKKISWITESLWKFVTIPIFW